LLRSDTQKRCSSHSGLEALRVDERSNGCLNWCGYMLPSPNHVLQISVKRRHKMTIETAGMQRPCSAGGLACDAIAVCS
jgi:hypothetical protein